MQKLTTQPDADRRRCTSISRTYKKMSTEEMGQLPPLKVQEVKTLKMVTKKTHKIPFLNLADLRHIERPRVLSLNSKQQEITQTERKDRTAHAEDVSFFLRECDLLITKKNPAYLRELPEATMKKGSILPPIMKHGHTSPVKFGKRLQNSQNTQEVKRKAPRIKAHCKVLLAKHNDFPFFGSHHPDNKRADRLKTKQSVNPQQLDFFDLDISCIIEPDEMPHLEFISQESFKQIPIF